MKNVDLFLFCGGLPFDEGGKPKPLMQVANGMSLIRCYLETLQLKSDRPKTITLLCDSEHLAMYTSELKDFNCFVPIAILSCESGSTTLEKFYIALKAHQDSERILHFSYPDIFFFGDSPGFVELGDHFDRGVAISVATLTSRFPGLLVDVYSNEVRGISDHTSLMPPNPQYVYGGDLWGRRSTLSNLANEFQSIESNIVPSLEYDFFFWLVNRRLVKPLMLCGEWLLVDSVRDVRRLLSRLPR